MTVHSEDAGISCKAECEFLWITAIKHTHLYPTTFSAVYYFTWCSAMTHIPRVIIIQLVHTKACFIISSVILLIICYSSKLWIWLAKCFNIFVKFLYSNYIHNGGWFVLISFCCHCIRKAHSCEQTKRVWVTTFHICYWPVLIHIYWHTVAFDSPVHHATNMSSATTLSINRDIGTVDWHSGTLRCGTLRYWHYVINAAKCLLVL